MQNEGLEVGGEKIVNLYVARAEGTDIYKIGHTQGLENRMRVVGLLIPFRMKPVIVLRCPRWCARRFELILLQRLKPRRVRGEWFRLEAEDMRMIRMDIIPVFVRFLNDYGSISFMPQRKIKQILASGTRYIC